MLSKLFTLFCILNVANSCKLCSRYLFPSSEQKPDSALDDKRQIQQHPDVQTMEDSEEYQETLARRNRRMSIAPGYVPSVGHKSVRRSRVYDTKHMPHALLSTLIPDDHAPDGRPRAGGFINQSPEDIPLAG